METICEYYPNLPPCKCTKGKVPHSIKTFFKSNENNILCISLSGGVDSMVTSWLIKQLCKNTEIYALHINYNNRETSDQEELFVKEWCEKIDIKFHSTKMHIKRDDYMKSDRQFYEKTTNTLRFDAYKTMNCPIVLGHNYDDCIENVITNISSHRSESNLKGMTEISTINNVILYRPLLNVAKKDIIAYAKKTHVPYLQDSTPKWSRRGRLRDIFIPTVSSIEPAFIKGLMNLINAK